ncbi:MAG: hypothetical protein CM1200mP41_22200 [Gammaproteobacteria bacterium]|nr:MAG: hypothetical protein CM1200mP41_22200 [Gammaproteobacteria bacterium]
MVPPLGDPGKPRAPLLQPVPLKHTGRSVAVVYLHRALQTSDTLFQCETWNTSHECFFDKWFIDPLEETPGQLTAGRECLNCTFTEGDCVALVIPARSNALVFAIETSGKVLRQGPQIARI